jgi:GntR family transcriptional regulator
MNAGFRIDPSDPRPIWRQIEENVRHLVASGALRPATAVPSVRDLARLLTVNPATVAKAYQRLTDAGVLAVRRGDGTYVAEAPPAISTRERRQRLDAEALRYASLAATLGATAREAAAALESAWRTLAETPGGRDGPPARAGDEGGGDAGAAPEQPPQQARDDRAGAPGRAAAAPGRGGRE